MLLICLGYSYSAATSNSTSASLHFFKTSLFNPSLPSPVIASWVACSFIGNHGPIALQEDTKQEVTEAGMSSALVLHNAQEKAAQDAPEAPDHSPEHILSRSQPIVPAHATLWTCFAFRWADAERALAKHVAALAKSDPKYAAFLRTLLPGTASFWTFYSMMSKPKETGGIRSFAKLLRRALNGAIAALGQGYTRIYRSLGKLEQHYKDVTKMIRKLPDIAFAIEMRNMGQALATMAEQHNSMLEAFSERCQRLACRVELVAQEQLDLHELASARQKLQDIVDNEGNKDVLIAAAQYLVGLLPAPSTPDVASEKSKDKSAAAVGGPILDGSASLAGNSDDSSEPASKAPRLSAMHQDRDLGLFLLSS
ncbi:hypothetical protein CBOM_00080 [Ceraceosorus bombacis]|uniref:Uncharacterized protein n=1 Tax=Ceraceosorus bombacis TaxID=401625 RepID=A0A0P1BA80_9BASI|nr:hypothetical protein CBOM_00080 [Ceraceosorus bombacis]